MKEEIIIRVIQTYRNGNHGMQQGESEVRWINLKAGERRTSPDAGRRNHIGQQPESNILVLNGIEKIQPIICASFNGNHGSTTVSCYSPTDASDKMDITTFYVQHTDQHNVLIIDGGMNAQTDKDRNNKSCFYNSLNRNGECLAKFSLENRLACSQTKLQKRKRKQWTYTGLKKHKTQLDYIFINKKQIDVHIFLFFKKRN